MNALHFDRETYTQGEAERLLIALGLPSGDIRPALQPGHFLTMGGAEWDRYPLTGEGVEQCARDRALVVPAHTLEA